MRYAGTSIALVLLLSLTAALQGQGQDHGRGHPAVAEFESTLGDATVPLSGAWRFHVGDDMAWARQDFDDSHWSTIDLTPPTGTEFGGGNVPGWTARGYPNYSGFAWYRLRVNIQSSRRLAIKMPSDVDDAYQVYVNGVLIGQFGRFGKHSVTAYSSMSEAFQLPNEVQNGLITIAIRMWMSSATPFDTPDAGGMHGPPLLGHAGVILALVGRDRDNRVDAIFSGCLELLILLFALTVAIMLFWLDRSEPAYLWFSLVCAALTFWIVLILNVNFVPWIEQTSAAVLMDVIDTPVRLGLWVIFWAYWFRIGRMTLVHCVVWGQVFLLMITTAALRPPLYGVVIPTRAAIYLIPIITTLKLTLAATLIAIAFQGIRKRKTASWLDLIALSMVVISIVPNELRAFLHLRATFLIHGFPLSLATVSTIFALLLITVMMLGRFLQTQRKREQWKAEIEQARQIQHMLIPDELPKIAGFAIDSEYRPAREVGGDFFQIIPNAADGSLLIVAGDVTGKGLQAGMLVAVLVGAIRTAASFTREPAEVLSHLNERLLGRGDAGATCLAMRIAADGATKLANSGHLPPYLNGSPMEIEGSLPLGVIENCDPSVLEFRLAPGDRLVLVSDGVAEATDENGNLFGFDRVLELVSTEPSAKQIAEAAQGFGQADDITVISVARVGVVEPALA